jgi:hypothetical protein
MTTSGHPGFGRPGDDDRCAACGGRVDAGEGLTIAGVVIHLRCALYRRRAAQGSTSPRRMA